MIQRPGAAGIPCSTPSRGCRVPRKGWGHSASPGNDGDIPQERTGTCPREGQGHSPGKDGHISQGRTGSFLREGRAHSPGKDVHVFQGRTGTLPKERTDIFPREGRAPAGSARSPQALSATGRWRCLPAEPPLPAAFPGNRPGSNGTWEEILRSQRGEHGNEVSEGAVHAPSLAVFKDSSDGLWAARSAGRHPAPGRGFERGDLWGPFRPKQICDPMEQILFY